MLLIAGLGNIGDKYKFNRHNLGFIVIDYLINQFGLTTCITKSNTVIYSLTINDTKILLIKPQVFMNLSGKPLYAISSFYKISSSNIIVFYDDVDLPLSKVRYKINSSSGGHNGIKNIQKYIGNNFHRIKIGVGRPTTNLIDLSNYVLSNFTVNELQDNINPMLEKLFNNFNLLINKDFKNFVEVINKE